MRLFFRGLMPFNLANCSHFVGGFAFGTGFSRGNPNAGDGRSTTIASWRRLFGNCHILFTKYWTLSRNRVDKQLSPPVRQSSLSRGSRSSKSKLPKSTFGSIGFLNSSSSLQSSITCGSNTKADSKHEFPNVTRRLRKRQYL
uniref:Uncharacterized protein n=1 Tax=Trichuris muris TaxID=70415 RepID=A0A5S6QV43_TRIMR